MGLQRAHGLVLRAFHSIPSHFLLSPHLYARTLLGNLVRPSGWTFIALLAAPGAFAQSHESREQLLQRGLAQLHAESFDSALAVAGELRRRWPEDPAGDVMAANVYQTMMRDYRVRAFEAPFDSSINRGLQLAEHQLRQQTTAENWFALGTSRGYAALHRFRRGDWSVALRDAVIALNAMNRSLQIAPEFIDPALALALYEYWKGVKLDFGLGILARRRALAIRLLEKVWLQGRYVSVDAAYSLQTIHMQKGDYQRALEINDWLHERFPGNVVCIHHRALLFEKLGRRQEALATWGKIIDRVRAFRYPSAGFQAECHLHRAQICEQLAPPVLDRSTALAIAAELELAVMHAGRRDAGIEIDGLFESFAEIDKAIAKMVKKYSVAVTR